MSRDARADPHVRPGLYANVALEPLLCKREGKETPRDQGLVDYRFVMEEMAGTDGERSAARHVIVCILDKDLLVRLKGEWAVKILLIKPISLEKLD